MRARWPLPMGLSRSSTRIEMSPSLRSSRIFSSGERGVRVEERLLDAEDQVLLAEPRIVLNVEALGHRVQLRDGFPLQLCDVHVCFGSVGAKAGKPRIWGNDALLVGVWESGDGCRSYPRPLARLRQGRVWT